MTTFSLDPRLEADCIRLASSARSLLLLRKDSRFPWLILVPMHEATELHQLPLELQRQVLDESLAIAAALHELPGVEKINFAAIGNIVRQLHIHVIGRKKSDAAWPGVVWGQAGAVDYEASQTQELVRQLRQRLPGDPWTWLV